jgi:hypothetical protein
MAKFIWSHYLAFAFLGWFVSSVFVHVYIGPHLWVCYCFEWKRIYRISFNVYLCNAVLLNNVIIIKTKVDPSFLWKCLYQVRAIAVFPVFRLLTNFVCLLTYEFCISLWKIARCSVILLLPLFPKAWVILSDFDLSCQCPFVFLLPKTFKLFGFPISGLWVYPKKGY